MILPITLSAASILSALFMYLSISVTRARFATNIGLGSDAERAIAGGEEASAPPLFVAIRSHAHFAEYVPLSLLLLGLLELAQANQIALEVMASTLVLARVLHPIGMGRKSPNAFRAGGNILQWLLLTVLAIYGLATVIQ